MKDAAPLLILMQAWRQGRHKKGDPVAKFAFSELCVQVDRLTAADRESGRASALDLLRARYRRQGVTFP